MSTKELKTLVLKDKIDTTNVKKKLKIMKMEEPQEIPKDQLFHKQLD